MSTRLRNTLAYGAEHFKRWSMDNLLTRAHQMRYTVSPDGCTVNARLQATPSDVDTSGPLAGLDLILRLFASCSDMVNFGLTQEYLPCLLQSYTDHNNGNPAMTSKFWKMCIHEDFYRAADTRATTGCKEWRVRQFLGHLGSSMYVLAKELREFDGGPVLATVGHGIIRVNGDTGKPDPIPEALRQKFRGVSCARSEKPVRLSLEFDLPTDVPVYEHVIKVDATHMRLNRGIVAMHVYYHFIERAVGKALRKGLLGHKRSHRVKEFDVVHNTAARLGDTLVVKAWKAAENTVHVILSRSEDKLAVGRLLFYGSATADMNSKL